MTEERSKRREFLPYVFIVKSHFPSVKNLLHLVPVLLLRPCMKRLDRDGVVRNIACDQAPHWGKSAKTNQRAERAECRLGKSPPCLFSRSRRS